MQAVEQPTDSFAPFGCPMGHGADAAAARPRRRRGYFVPGLIALAVMVAVGGAVNFAGLDHSGQTGLAGADVSTFVAQGLQAERGLGSPPQIHCPAHEPVRAGLSFTCRWDAVGGRRSVKVTEIDSRGQFRFTVVR